MKEDVISFKHSSDDPFYVPLCGISYCDGNYRISRSNSEIYVMEYIISGTGTVIENERRFYPREGDIYFLKRGANHIYYSDENEPWVKIWMNFSGRLASKITEYYSLNDMTCFNAPQLKKYFFDIYRISRSGIGTKAVFNKISVIFLKLAQELSELYIAEKYSDIGVAESVRAYIDDMTEFSMNMEDIAKNMSYSKNHIIRSFKEKYGTTPYDYLLERRFETARSLLKNTSYTVTEISEKLGFCDVRYFGGCFKKRYGITPGKYRKIR